MSARNHAPLSRAGLTEPDGHVSQPAVRAPERHTPQPRAREKMDVDPPEPRPLQAMTIDEGHHLAVRRDRRGRECLDEAKDLAATAQRPARQFADDEWVGQDEV